MKRTGFALFIAMVAVVGLNASASASLILNGSFEDAAPGVAYPGSYTTLGTGSTAIAGWTVSGVSVDWIGTYWTSAHGKRSLDLAGLGDGGVFATNAIPTVVGQTYMLRFAMAGNPAGAPSTKTMLVSINNDPTPETYTFSTAGKTLGNMGWVYNELVFTADSSNTSIQFSNSGGTAFGAALDDVSLTAIPEPTTLIIWSLLGGLALTMWRRR